MMWNKISDKPLPTSGVILVCVRQHETYQVFIGRRSSGIWMEGVPPLYYPSLTHWMRLPLPPDAKGRCRKCKEPVMSDHESIGTGVTQVGEGCFLFHQKCRDALTPEQAAECNKCSSTLFEGD